ncbi:MAG TPA: GtrA family protein [Marinagarivorans sp.]|nr:GtrA family protein [Marinagarivorans sp.]HNG61738.1 GtrA family protein [Cellvibrionaceae bacterium]
MPIRFAQQFFAGSLGKFLLVGGLATAAQFATLFVLVELGLCRELTASGLGYGVGAVVNYLLNYYVTFNSKQNHLATLPKFIAVVAFGLSVNTLVFYLANLVLPWYGLSQCVATGASLVANYLLHRFWIYRKG